MVDRWTVIHISWYTGSGLGTLTIGPVLQHFSENSGLATSLRVLSAFAAVLLLAAMAYKPFRSPLMDMYNIKRTPAPFVDLQVWRNKAFLVYTLAVLIFMVGYFIPFVHLVSKTSCPFWEHVIMIPSVFFEDSSLGHLS